MTGKLMSSLCDGSSPVRKGGVNAITNDSARGAALRRVIIIRTPVRHSHHRTAGRHSRNAFAETLAGLRTLVTGPLLFNHLPVSVDRRLGSLRYIGETILLILARMGLTPWATI
jgi:hypothetical protein